MAINPYQRYLNVLPPNQQYPLGSAKNAASVGSIDGTPWEAAGINDLYGLLQKLLYAAGITPSGDPDNVLVSDYFDALTTIFPVVEDVVMLINPQDVGGVKNFLDGIRLSGSTPAISGVAQGVTDNEEIVTKGWVNDELANLGTFGFLHVIDQKNAGESGGDFLKDAWQTRTFNTVVVNTIPGAVLAANEVTLPKGKYEVAGSAPAYLVDAHQAKLMQASSDLIFGTTEFASNSWTISNRSFINGFFSFTDSSMLTLVHRCQSSKSNNGFGYTPPGETWITPVYSELCFKKYPD